MPYHVSLSAMTPLPGLYVAHHRKAWLAEMGGRDHLTDLSAACLQGIGGQLGLSGAFPLGNPGSALPNGTRAACFQGKLGAAFDPLSPSDVEKLNAAFISRHQAALLGSHLRA